MIVYGEPNTLNISVDQMAAHTAAVCKGAPKKFVVADMPFLSFRKGLVEGMNSAEKLIKAGAQALKIEGASGNTELIKHLVESGIPVMGHLGLTPQFFNQFGGFKVQGKTEEAAQKISTDAKVLQDSGCFSLVLECIPAPLATEVSQSIQIPTIGIGAGKNTDGQILVLQDLLGAFEKNPRFVRPFARVNGTIESSINDYCQEVICGTYPADKETY